tara:strand:+ start:2590 stop:2931 length:342 start_codon:yes stop_codon:yes gene_type:complete
MTDIVKGSKIKFTESVFGGGFRNPKFLGTRTITGIVINESYGEKRGQHTFRIKVLDCDGWDSKSVKPTIFRKGRNVYRDCEILSEPENFLELADEKHARAAKAKALRWSNIVV